jgi:hypothetical protein
MDFTKDPFFCTGQVKSYGRSVLCVYIYVASVAILEELYLQPAMATCMLVGIDIPLMLP